MNVALLPWNDYSYMTVQAVHFRIRNAVLVFKKDVGCGGTHAGAFSPVFYLFIFPGGPRVWPAGRQRIVMPLRVTWIVMEACWRRRTTWWISAVCVCLCAACHCADQWRRLTRVFSIQIRMDGLKGESTLNNVNNKVVINFYQVIWTFFSIQILVLILFSLYFIFSTYLMHLHSQGSHRNRIQMMSGLFYKREAEEEALFLTYNNIKNNITGVLCFRSKAGPPDGAHGTKPEPRSTGATAGPLSKKQRGTI